MKIALVTDSMSSYGGAERVIEQILQVYPSCDIFALLDTVPPDQRAFLGGRAIKTSSLQRLPRVRHLYRKVFPLWPIMIEQFDLRAYDLVISSHHSVANGVITHPHQVHVSYVHSPMRYAWDLQHEYLRETGLDRGPLSWLARWLLHYSRSWDAVAARRPDAIAANSAFVQRRIQKYYGRSSQIIYPPVATERFETPVEKGGYYLSVCRLVPYKRVALLIEAFAVMPDRRLKIVGAGPELKALRSSAPPNVEILGWQSSEIVAELMAGAEAFLYAGVEDFGITMVEAQAAGTPVIAFRQGGAAETVVDIGSSDQPTGVLFRLQDPATLIAAIDRFERSRSLFSASACRANADHFAEARFRIQFAAFVEQALATFSPNAGKRPADPSNIVPANDRGGAVRSSALATRPSEGQSDYQVS